MEEKKSSLLGKSLAIILGIVFIIILGMGGLSFFKPENKINKQSRDIDENINIVWKAIANKNYYLSSRKEITNFIIYDSLRPRWTEYFGKQDSVENRVYKLKEKKLFSYTIINRKYEQVNGIAILLDSIQDKKTKITIVECSQYFNTWAGIYFQLFHPNTVLDYEYIKINNTIHYIDSLSKK